MAVRIIVDSTVNVSADSTQNLAVVPIGSVIGTHAGPGAIAVAFLKRK